MSTKTDERPNAREREQRLGFVSRPRFEDYQSIQHSEILRV